MKMYKNLIKFITKGSNQYILGSIVGHCIFFLCPARERRSAVSWRWEVNDTWMTWLEPTEQTTWILVRGWFAVSVQVGTERGANGRSSRETWHLVAGKHLLLLTLMWPIIKEQCHVIPRNLYYFCLSTHQNTFTDVTPAFLISNQNKLTPSYSDF